MLGNGRARDQRPGRRALAVQQPALSVRRIPPGVAVRAGTVQHIEPLGLRVVVLPPIECGQGITNRGRREQIGASCFDLPGEKQCIRHTPSAVDGRHTECAGYAILQPPNNRPACQRIVPVALDEQRKHLVGEIPLASAAQALGNAERKRRGLGGIEVLGHFVAFGKMICRSLRILLEMREKVFDLASLGKAVQRAALGLDGFERRPPRIAPSRRIDVRHDVRLLHQAPRIAR